jgi:hypothetical protein
LLTKYLKCLPFLAILAVVAPLALAAPPFTSRVPGDVMTQYRNLRTNWTTNIWVYANQMFGLLAVIEFGWSVIALALDKTDLQSWTSGLIRKLMWIGAFYALLINGRIWIPAIIDSFEIIGSNAAGTGPLSPSDVFAQGIGIAAALMDGASTSAFFTNPASSFALVFAALIIVVSYTIVTINFIVTMVESYIAVSAGFLFHRIRRLAVDCAIRGEIHRFGRFNRRQDCPSLLPDQRWAIARGRLADRGSGRGNRDISVHDGLRRHGCRAHLHDAVLAYSKAVRRSARRVTRSHRRRLRRSCCDRIRRGPSGCLLGRRRDRRRCCGRWFGDQRKCSW